MSRDVLMAERNKALAILVVLYGVRDFDRHVDTLRSALEPDASHWFMRAWDRVLGVQRASPRHARSPADPSTPGTGYVRAMTIAFDPISLGREEDPYAQLAAVREAGPVVRLEVGVWAVTGYDAALAALRSRSCASGPLGERVVEGLPEGAARDEMRHRINFLDPPDHTRVRTLVSKAFTPRRVEALVPWIERTADSLAGAVGERLEFDLLREFAHQLPSLVISELLGVPVDDRDQLTAWSEAVTPLLAVEATEDERAGAVRAAEDFHEYLSSLLDERRGSAGDDLLSAMAAAEDDGERLSEPELLSLAATLYSAGHRTTRDLFANGMSVLLESPDLYADVVRGRWQSADVITEFLRFVTPTLFVARIARERFSLGGAEIPAGEPLLIYLAAANRDPAAFPDPDVFRPGRDGPRPLSFAHGTHFCLGAALATAEAQAMLETAIRRWPQLSLCPERPPRRHQRGTFRGLADLWVSPRSDLPRHN